MLRTSVPRRQRAADCGRLTAQGRILRRVDRLDALREDLWARWRREWGQVASDEPGAVSRMVYGRGPLFDLKDYTPRAFKPAKRPGTQPFPGVDNRIYGLDQDGRPVSMRVRHSFNRVDWRGVYRYADNEAEYAEWCLQTGVPSQFDRMALEDGVPKTFQRVIINGRGSFPVWRSLFASRLMNTIAADPKHYQVWIEAYDVGGGRIESAEVYTEGLGAPPMRSRLEYEYDGDRLQRIQQAWASGERRTVFAARGRQSLAALSADLSRRIAERTIELLRAARLDAPLAAVELSYQAGESYVPFVIPATSRDALEERGLCVAIDDSRWIQLDEEAFAPAITDFAERVRSGEHHESGARMLREAARQVTAAAPGVLPTSPSFVAYAIDWEAEGDDLESILVECGASPRALEVLRERGWI